MVPATALIEAFGAEITKNDESVIEFTKLLYDHRVGGDVSVQYRLEKNERIELLNLSDEDDNTRDINEIIHDSNWDESVLNEGVFLVNLRAILILALAEHGEVWYYTISPNMRSIEFTLEMVWV